MNAALGLRFAVDFLAADFFAGAFAADFFAGAFFAGAFFAEAFFAGAFLAAVFFAAFLAVAMCLLPGFGVLVTALARSEADPPVTGTTCFIAGELYRNASRVKPLGAEFS